MSKVKLIRVDYRMIHGQIVAKWIKFRPVDRLILADDLLVSDPFMGDIYRMAVPEKEVDIVKLSEIQNALNKKDDTVLLIFRTVDSAFQAFKSGISLPELNVGAIESNKDRRSILQGVSLSIEEFKQLKEMEKAGTDVFFQPIPENDSVKLKSVEKKFL